MNAVLLIVAIIAMSAQNIAKKEYNIRTSNGGAMLFSAISVFSAVIFFLVKPDLDLFGDLSLLPYAFAFAVTYAFAVIFSYLALSCGSLALTSLVTSYSLMIPTLYGILFLNEKTSIWLFLGIALLCVSLVFINLEKTSKGEKKLSFKWAVFVLLAFLGNGLCSTVQKQQQLDFNGMYKNELMIISLFCVGITVFIISVITERKNIKSCIKFSWIAVICGVANGLVNMLVMTLSNRMPASLMFPLMSSGGIITSVAVSIFVYKEKLSLMQKLGVILGIGAIICLNL